MSKWEAKFPINRLLSCFKKVSISLGKMFTAEEAGIGGVRGGVRSFEDKVLARVYQAFFFLGKLAPEEENDIFSFVRKSFDGGVG